jgi:hypothetical protein
MPFLGVNFGLKTKMPSTVINKKNIKEVAGATFRGGLRATLEKCWGGS